MSTVANIFRIPELRRRILFTLGMLAVYRIGIFVTTPGVDRAAMRKYVAGQSGGFLSMFNLFSGGALEQASIFALNIMPYVSASIILSLMTVVAWCRRSWSYVRKARRANARSTSTPATAPLR
jgi:preprotein translocase subunit SecY